MRSLAALALAFTLPLAASAQTASPAPAHHDDHDAMSMGKAPVPPSKSLNITVGGHTTTLTLDDLLKLPQATVNVHNAHRNVDETYTGPLVADVLTRAGLTPGKETDALLLHSALLATGTDHYFVLYSASEVEPSFSKSQVILALMKSGLPNTEGGLIQLINTDAAKPARWVHGLANLNLVTMTPQP